jgi:hypothetical protein
MGGKWNYNVEGKLVQSTLYTRIELSQSNPFVLLMHTNSKYNKTFKNI